MTLWLDMLGSQTRYLQTPSYGKTRILEAGMDNPDKLIFLHGVGGHAEAYSRNIVPLSDRFHCIAYDYPGHGLSAKINMQYTPQVLVDHLRELLDTLGIERANLSGESLGGWVSGLFATRYPQRVKRLMLNTAAGLPILTEQGRKDLQDLVDLTSRATTQGPPTYDSVQKRMQWLFHPDNYGMISDELINTRLACYTQPGMKEVAPKVLGIIAMHDDHLIPLHEIQCETLFLWTRDNPVHDIDCAKSSATQIPGSQLYIMQAPAAHWPQYEAPEEFNRVTGDFFATGSI